MAAIVASEIVSIAQTYLAALRAGRVAFDAAYLFGSHAEGRAHEHSDIDIALVMRDEGVRFLREVELVKYRRGIDTRIEPHIYTQEELDSPYGPDIKQRGLRLA